MAANGRGARLVRRIKDKTIMILATLAFTLSIIPIFIFFMVPCYIYRKLIIYLAQWFKPQLGKLLCARSALAAIDDIYTSPKCTLLGVGVVEGEPDLEQLRQTILNRVVLAKDLKGRLMYPEFQQYFSRWGGFLFWKWEKKFSINDHVNIHTPSETKDMSEMDVINLRIQLISKPYEKGISPWEFIVVKNYVPTNPLMIDFEINSKDGQKSSKKAVLIMRIHHGVSDGYSLLKLHLNAMQAEKLKLDDIPQPKYHRRNYLKTGIYYMWAAFCVPYYVTQQLMMMKDNNYFHPKGVELKRKCHAAGTTLPVSIVKEIRTKNTATFSAVLTSALAGGIRNYMLSNGLEIPDKMHVSSPLPWKGHPDKMRNYWSFCIMNLPLNVPDAKERLRILNKTREKIIRSTIPLLNFVLVPLVGALPVPFIRFVTKRKATTIMMSNFPGPQEPSSMFGFPIRDASFGGGFGRGNLGFGVSMISYNGTIRIGIGVDQALIPSQAKVQELLSFIKDEIYTLGQDAIA